MTVDSSVNETNIITRIEEELPKSTLYWFFISLAAAVIWTIYITYYNSRVTGLIVTLIVNKFLKYGRVNIGSFSVSVLSGKIMFRAVHFFTEDFSVRIEYGWIIFKWWRPYVYKDIKEDMSHSETRLYCFIDQFEFHVYNRSGTYDSLEKLFGHHDNDTESCEIQEEPSGAEIESKKNNVINKNNIQWRDLIPVSKFDISSCRFVFGNNLVPNTLIVHLDDSHVTYTSTPASTVFDEFMHDLKVKSESIRIILVPSDNYTGGIVDEPPRMMGEGFVVMQSTDVKVHFYMDQPGTVPYEPEIVALADGETVVRQTYPTIGLDIQCGKNTDFNYGPWADRQREYLWKFFYPSSYQPLVPSKVPASGEKRQYRTFEFRMNIVAQATIDILFTKYSITQAIHVSMGQGSYVESSIPWVTEETGFQSFIKGQLLLLEATTSMQFRSLLECETLDFSVTAAYPLEWNAHQDWKYSFTACKATAFLIFQHKHFFSDLIDDWSTKSVPDVYHFVPYTYNINLIINQFELVTLCNEYNWIDTSSQHPENAHIAFCGETFDLSIQLPYTDHLPLTNSISFIFKVENVFCRLYLPENNTSRHVMIAMSENMKIVDRDGNILEKPFCYDIDKQWRNLTQRSAGWIDCWQTSNVALTITYKYHPMPPLMKSDSHHIMISPDDSLITAQDPEEALLIPLRPMRPVSTSSKIPDDFDAGQMDSDLISVELEVAPSVVCAYGSLLRNFLHVKENYLGEDQSYTDFYDQPRGYVEPKSSEGVEGPLTEKEVAEREFDARKYRPFAVTVSVTLHDIQGHLVKNCNMADVPCPSVYVERIGFEMDKSYEETKLQVLISPAVLIAKDNVEREADQTHLKEGHIGLSGLQVRGHAMFSHKGLALDSETLEYAWLVEAIVGDITGKLTSPQIQNIVESLQTFVMLVEDPENSLQRPLTYQQCQHMIPQPQCKKLQPQYLIPCPSSEDIKYRMTRASVDCINIHLVEAGTALNVQIYPLRLSTCNLHGNNTRAGINCLIEHISLKQFISTAPIRHDSHVGQPEIWLESGGLSLGPINAEAAMALPNQDFHNIQDNFLKLHDFKTNRLWFLWPGDGIKVSTSVMGKCGCLGGCAFFGNNRNGVAFFHPKKFHEVTPTAICKVSPEGMDPGFGQSLLHKNKLVFDIGDSGWLSPTREFTFTRGYMSSVTTPDTPVTSITVVEEINASPRHLVVESINESAADIKSQKVLPRSPTGVSETPSSSSVITTSPSEVLSGESISTNPFDTARSVDSGTLKESGRGSLADGHGSSVGNVSLSSSQSPPPFSPTLRSPVVRSPSSRSSGQSPSGRSSVTSRSPSLLRRLRYSSHHDPSRQTSTISLESEMYYSAEEDAYSSSDQAGIPDKNIINQEIHSSGSDSVNWGTIKPDPSMKLDLDSSPFSTKEKTVIERKDSSSSFTNSTLSYMSADTDPDDTLSQGLLEEELSMVDLHGQVNKPITKSPVLLPCYSGHLTRLQCSNWSTQSPFPSKYHGITVDPPPTYESLHSAQSSRRLSSVFVPRFVKTKQGFSTRIMRAKEAMFAAMEKDTLSPPMDDSLISDTVDGPMFENTSRTTATVKLKGSLDVLVTPLLLESLQRLCEAVTPALTNLHPSSILDNLHFRCLDRLKSQNILKKAENMADPDTPDSPDSDEAPGEFDATQRPCSADNRGGKTMEVKTSSYQALLTLSRINICMLQAGMVEEKISFSALDNISELTCVSLIGISINNIRCQLLSNSHSCKTTNDVLPSVLTASPARNRTKDGKVDSAAEVEKENVPEILREEDVGTLHMNSVHLQLRRLLRDGHISEDVILTAIPEHKSKVMFSFENDVTKLFSPKSGKTHKVRRSQSGRESIRTPSFSRDFSQDVEERKPLQTSIDENNPFDAAPTPKLLRQKSKDSSEDPRRRISSRFDEKHSIGYIMFECGLEDIVIRAVRRLGYKEKSDAKFYKRMEEVNQEAEVMQASARAEVDGQGHSSDSQGHGQAQSSSQSQSHSRSQKTSDSSKPSITLGSQDIYPSSNSVHSWDSRVSIPSDASVLVDEEPLKGDASSGTLNLKTVWFNFAAPPPLPIKRKADFTKKDWNLLSTATPAINAWMSPFDRLMTAVRTLVQELTHRTNSVMACIMTEGLDVQSIHMPLKSKYMRNTNFSRTLQEDASCQMLTVLRRYLHMMGTSSVEQAVISDTIPQLITIQKGILALTRQWKNVLYMPQLSKLNFKSRKHRPYTVTFKLPASDDEDDGMSVNMDVVDERASLIDVNSMRETESLHSLYKPTSPSNLEMSSMTSAPGMSKPKRKQVESRYQQIQKALFSSPKRQETNPHMTSLLRNESVHSIHSEGRGSVVEEPAVGPTPPSTPYKGIGVEAVRQKVLRSKIDGNSDLYRWMAAQQEGFHSSHTTVDDDHMVGGVRRQDSFLEAFGGGLNQEDSHTDVNVDNYTMGTSIMQLADAQNLFKPFLQSIGLHVESVRPTAMMKKFGGNLSLQGRLDILKIEIADSVRGKGKGKGKKRRDSKFVDTTHDTPAFLSESFTINISMRDVVDFEKKGSLEDKLNNKYPFKFAMHKLEAKPATLQVNLMVNCQSVTQHVDMPLLRLIHQFVTVIDNVNETRMELKQGHSSVDWIRTHRKQDSKGSTSSNDTQHSDASRAGLAGIGLSKSADSPVPSRTNLAAEAKPVDPPKPARTHKPSISSFKFQFDTIRTEGFTGLTSTLKKSHLKFSKDSKKVKDQKSPGGHSQVMTPPQSLNLSDSVNIDMGDSSSPAVAEKTFVDEIKESTPKCWRTLYHLLELYSTMPETKTVSHRPDRGQLPIIEEEAEKPGTETPSDSIKTRLDVAAEEEAGVGVGSSGGYENTPLARSTFSRTRFKQSIYIGDSVPLVVFGIAKLEKVKILAVLSGLKLEGELRNVHASGTIKEKVKGFLQRKSSESSVTAHVGSTQIVLLEGPNLQTVVTVNVAKSQGLHTTVMRRGKGHNSALVSIGAIDIDIPQHPVVLHGMMTRGTRQLSTTLQEFRRPIPRSRADIPEYGTLDSRSSGQEPQISTLPRAARFDGQKGGTIHIHLKAVIQGVTIGASLLPSLKAQHKTGPITITAVTVKKARFTLDLPSHTLSFKSKDGPLEKVTTMETSIPSSASIDLPPIHVYADYRQYKANAPISEALTEGLMLKEGNYLNGVAEVGMFEHSLTTDLLNHLVFVQKVFMKEVNELLQKVSGSDKPVPIWSETAGRQLKSPSDHILYSFHFRLKGIQITATTPTASAVRLETEAIDLEVSNRVQMAAREAHPNIVYEDSQKVFIKAQVDLNVALGQLLKNPLFEEADPEFQTMAFFKTKIGIRNALQDEMIPGVSTDQEALLITLSRPIVLAQPMAFDKAVLVWLNYKNAYEYWTEQRLALNKEVQTATQQVIDRLPQISSSTQQAFSTLFLQLTVDDIGLCLPIQAVNTEGPSRLVDEPGAAVVITIESTQISACSSGSLVSKGKFTDFCLRIAEDFETSLDDWKPSPGDVPVMNACVVPEGTYEVSSRTTNRQSTDSNSNAKWILNIKWEMQGIDVHLDTNIGKRLSLLGDTLTSLTGEEDEDFLIGDEPDGRHDVSLEDLSDIQAGSTERRTSVAMESLPKFVYDTTIDPKHRARLIEKEMNEQAKVVQDLKDLGASQTTIELESRKLEELKSIIFHEFKREVLNRLKKQSEKASVIKDKLGIGSNPAHIRSRSFGGRNEKHRESAPSDLLSVSSREHGRVRGISDTAEAHPSKVQFGETTSATYTPPITPEGTPQHVAAGVDHRRAKSLYEPSSSRDQLLSSVSSSSSLSSSEHTSDESSGDAVKTVFQVDSDQLGSGTVTNEMGASSNPSIGSGSKSVQEPNVDFELDIKVFIDSGKCVLHPKDSKDDEQRRKRDKTPTPESPPGQRKMKKTDSGNLQGAQGKKQQQQPQPENTVFFLPGVDVKVHYNSKTDPIVSPSNTLTADSVLDSTETITMDTTIKASDTRMKVTDSSSSTLDREYSHSSCGSVTKRQGLKKASLYAWLSLQPLPEETFISPCLLDFLEQALEPIPISLMAPSKKDAPDQTVIDSVLNMDLNSSSTSIGSPALLGSFPVDVVVLIRVEPSVIRFNCLPTSRVECLLKIPSLELVFSTKRSEAEAWVQSDGTPPLKAKFTKMKVRERNLSGGRDARSRASSTTSELASSSVSSGGLSVTACLSDFSLYIFHPYGGGQGKPGAQVSPAGRILGSIQEQSVLGDISRKDSLSLKVEFINLNISRSRKLEIKSDGISLMDKLDPMKSNMVRFSAVCDIGSAAFKYDMRRLSEILSFPKSWYRRNLARRLFLGDESGLLDEGDDWSSISSTTSSIGGGDGSGVFTPNKSHTSNPTLHVHALGDLDPQGHHRRGSSGDKIKIQISPEFRNELADRHAASKAQGFSVPQSPTDATHGTPDSITMASGIQTRPKFSRRNSHPPMPRQSSTRSGSERKTAGWQTLVLYAVNLSQLDVHVNMSNVMGNTVWNTRDIKSQGRLSIDSTGHKNLKITFGLGGSHFDSKGGVVGGSVDLQDINTHFEVSEDPKLGKDPLHRAGLSMDALEGRVDYMGSSILMARLSDMTLTLRDEWKIDKVQDFDAPLATTRAALLFAHGDLGWDKFHILISRSTTPDLIKIAAKLEEFIMQQFTSSKRVFGAMGPIPASVRQKQQEKHKSGDEESFLSELRHHRHWQKALENITGCHFTMLPSMLPKEGMILGGNLTLHGKNLSLACFHGINFRSKAWAIFTMNDVYIGFATEAQKTQDQATHVVQDLTFYVGHGHTHYMHGKHMAYVLKMSRGHTMPPTFTHANEWFHYAFATSEVKDLDKFPTMKREGSESPSDYRKSRKYADYAHETEVIFALPPMQLHLVTKHNQAEHEPLEDDPKPVVECSFITEFEDHTLVAMDAEVILFLHDLISSYIREKDKGARVSSAGTSSKSAKAPAEGADKKKKTDPLTVLQQDWRDYECITWQLEPTVRLLHWASKQIDPVGVDYVLQKLGFTHARQTIPKWMQRGFMDPSDKIISMLVNKLIVFLRENPEARQ